MLDDAVGRRRSAVELSERALLRRLVLAPAAQLCTVANAPGGDVIEVDLNDQLRAQRHPLEVLAGAPTTGLRRAALARLIRSEEADETLLLSHAETGAVTHDAQLAAVVETEDQRPHCFRFLTRPPADDDGVDRAYPLDLRHALALAGTVRRRAFLRDREGTLGARNG